MVVSRTGAAVGRGPARRGDASKLHAEKGFELRKRAKQERLWTDVAREKIFLLDPLDIGLGDGNILDVGAKALSQGSSL
jgi:hypothetical protein